MQSNLEISRTFCSSSSIRNQEIRQMGWVSFKKSYGGGKSTGGDVSEVTSSATPRQSMGVDTVSPKTVLSETGRFKATHRSLSPFKWGLIA